MPLPPSIRIALFCFSCAWAVSACASATLSSVPAKEANDVTTPGSTQAGTSRLTAEQALTRLVELIRSSHSLGDLTAERVSEIMGVQVKRAEDGSGDYSFYEPSAPGWLHGFDFSTKYRRFSFSFDPIRPGTSPDPAVTCSPDLAQVASALEAAGFTKTPHYDAAPPPPPEPLPFSDERPTHGRLLDYTFERKQDKAGMAVVVYPGDSIPDVQDGTSRACVGMMRVH
jgi:hypothetical protein